MVSKEQALEILQAIKKHNPMEMFKRLTKTDSGMGCILIYLSENKNAAYASSISESMNISRARIAVLLKKMEMRELISKTASAQDARIDVVSLTKKGELAIEEMKAKRLTTVMKIINQVGIEDVKKFVEIAEKIKKAIREQEDI